jgi:hypothetical protein
MKLRLSPDTLALNPGLSASLTVEREQRTAKQARLPRAVSEAATGLWGLIERGWSVESPDSVRYRLYVVGVAGLDTGLQPTEKDACDRAKALEGRTS